VTIHQSIRAPDCASAATIGHAGATDASGAPPPMPLPVHSPLGGSAVDRWSKCSGSVALIEVVRSANWYSEEDPEYRREGVEAHALAAWCLRNNADCWEAPPGEFPSLTAEMMDAVQVYVDFCRKFTGENKVEFRVSRPEFHELFYGQLDFASIAQTEGVVTIVDYKHGVGVVVEPNLNSQLMYYAYGLIGEDRDVYPDDIVVELVVVQPRVVHVDGPIRKWSTTAGQLRAWASDFLRPAMDRTLKDRFLSVGEWCRFCPAKLICPAMRNLVPEILSTAGPSVSDLSHETLGSLYEKWQHARKLGKAIEDEVLRRLMDGAEVPGVKLVSKRADRQWKEGAPVEETFGLETRIPSPAQVEKKPGGREFTAQWSYVPEAGYTVALADDRRPAVLVKSGAERFVVNESDG
jgi:hypothetical protein